MHTLYATEIIIRIHRDPTQMFRAAYASQNPSRGAMLAQAQAVASNHRPLQSEERCSCT